MSLIRKSFSPILLTISLLLLFYTFYKSEIYWDGSKRNFYFNYYIFSILVLIFSIFSFFISKKIKDYFILILGSVLVSLYSFESFLSFGTSSKYNNKFELYKENTGKEYDKRSKFEIYKDFQLINTDIKMMVYPTYYFGRDIDIFPLAMSSYSKTINCNENGYYSIYESDRYGFNNPDKEWDQQEIEFLLVGDSFTQGCCVNRPNDMGSVLRILSNKSVLNLGFNDHGPLLEYATLREYLKPNVKKILWFYFEGNDLLGLKDKFSNKILSKYVSDLNFKQDLKNKQDIINIMTDELIKEQFNKNIEITQKRSSHNFFKILKLYNLRTLLASKQEPELIPEFEMIINLANDLAVRNNSKLYFIYLPDYSRYKNKFKFENYFKIKAMMNDLDIPFIDIDKEVFKKEENPLKLFPFEQVGHYNEEGYRKVAQKIFELAK